MRHCISLMMIKFKKQRFYSRYSVDDSIFILMFICEERQGWLVRNRGTEFPRTGQASLALTSKLGTFTALSLVSGYDDIGHNVEDCKQEETDLKQQEKKESGLSCDQDSHDQTWAHTVCPTSPSPNVRFSLKTFFFRNVTFRLSVSEPWVCPCNMVPTSLMKRIYAVPAGTKVARRSYGKIILHIPPSTVTVTCR